MRELREMTPSFIGNPRLPAASSRRGGDASARERGGSAAATTARASFSTGDIVRGRVARLAKYGAFVELPGGVQGLVHISEIADAFVEDISEFVNPGDEVDVRVIAIERPGRFSLSIKQCREQASGYERMMQLGGDFGDPWNNDGETRWADLGDRPDPGPEFWEKDRRNFTPFEPEAEVPDLTNFKPFEDADKETPPKRDE